MSTSIVELAKAVTTELASVATGMPTTITRAYLPLMDLQDFADLRLTVLSRSADLAPLTRGGDQNEQQVVIAVQKKVDPSDLDEVDALVVLTETIAAHYRSRKFAACPQASHQRTTIDPVVNQAHLHEKRIFTSVITLQYRQM